MGSIGTCFGIESKGNKIEYFSPDISGLSFGISFTPTGGQRRAGGGLSYGTDVTAPGSGDTGNNILSVAADYVHDFDGFEVTLGGGAEWAFTQYTSAGGTSGNKPAWYQGGLQVDFGHFAVGFSGAYYQNYLHDDYSAANTASSGDDGWVVAVGGSYTIDAWSFGLQGVYGSYQQNASVILATSAPGISADNEKLWGVSLNTCLCARTRNLVGGPDRLHERQLRQPLRPGLFGSGPRGRGRQCQSGPRLGDRSRHWDKFLAEEFAASCHRRAGRVERLAQEADRRTLAALQRGGWAAARRRSWRERG
jgi:Outer membrane protein (porin)